MLRTMVSEFSEAGFDVVTTLDKRLVWLADWLDADVRVNRGGLSAALKCGPDAALVIAPERGRELEGIVTKLMKVGVTVLGSKANVIRTCADKWLTYNALEGTVPQPRTWKKGKSAERVLTKPVDGVGCEGIKFITPPHESESALFQEFVEGEHASCCLLMGEEGGTVLSVNKQEIAIRQNQFRYVGSTIPLDHPLKEKCVEIALKAAEHLNLRGYCGIDFVIGGYPYFIEANPRVTTTFVALAQMSRANLGKILVDMLIDGATLPKLQLKGYSLVRIPKVRKNMSINVKKLGKLREILGVISPPLTLNGKLQKGSPLLVLAGAGRTLENVRHKLEGTLDEAAALIGVNRDAIAWA